MNMQEIHHHFDISSFAGVAVPFEWDMLYGA